MQTKLFFYLKTMFLHGSLSKNKTTHVTDLDIGHTFVSMGNAHLFNLLFFSLKSLKPLILI